MVDLAKHCAFTRRALYFYFSNKKEALRALVAPFNAVSIRLGFKAGHAVRGAGGSAAEILAEILDIRYGESRRNVSRSPHLIELNGEILYQTLMSLPHRSLPARRRSSAGLS